MRQFIHYHIKFAWIIDSLPIAICFLHTQTCQGPEMKMRETLPNTKRCQTQVAYVCSISVANPVYTKLALPHTVNCADVACAAFYR